MACRGADVVAKNNGSVMARHRIGTDRLDIESGLLNFPKVGNVAIHCVVLRDSSMFCT